MPYLSFSMLRQYRSQHASDWFADRLSVAHLHVTPNNGADRNTFHFPSMPWCRFVFAMQLICVDYGLFIHVHDCQIGIGTDADCALLWIELPYSGRIFTGDFDIMIQRHPPFVNLR